MQMWWWEQIIYSRFKLVFLISFVKCCEMEPQFTYWSGDQWDPCRCWFHHCRTRSSYRLFWFSDYSGSLDFLEKVVETSRLQSWCGSSSMVMFSRVIHSSCWMFHTLAHGLNLILSLDIHRCEPSCPVTLHSWVLSTGTQKDLDRECSQSFRSKDSSAWRWLAGSSMWYREDGSPLIQWRNFGLDPKKPLLWFVINKPQGSPDDLDVIYMKKFLGLNLAPTSELGLNCPGNCGWPEDILGSWTVANQHNRSQLPWSREKTCAGTWK